LKTLWFLTTNRGVSHWIRGTSFKIYAVDKLDKKENKHLALHTLV
jgi:hypothetical protein